jgi:hypothetical protein
MVELEAGQSEPACVAGEDNHERANEPDYLSKKQGQ